MKHFLITTLSLIMGLSLYSQDWGTYKALRGTDDWAAKRRAKEAELRMMEKKYEATKFSYGIPCGEMGNNILKNGELKVTLDHLTLKSDFLYKVSI